ncbi:MAG: hypothetical protein ACK53Y_17140 [bacterium]
MNDRNTRDMFIFPFVSSGVQPRTNHRQVEIEEGRKSVDGKARPTDVRIK